MQKLKAILGYLVAVITIIIVLPTFVGLEGWGNRLVYATQLRVSPWFSGGDIERTMNRNGYNIILHKPVFMGLIGETSTGFVQMEWTPFSALHGTINDEVDYDGDGQNDFRVRLDTVNGQAKVYPENDRVIGLNEVLKLREGWMVRINLRNKSR